MLCSVSASDHGPDFRKVFISTSKLIVKEMARTVSTPQRKVAIDDRRYTGGIGLIQYLTIQIDANYACLSIHAQFWDIMTMMSST
jgi:hypothetical protein